MNAHFVRQKYQKEIYKVTEIGDIVRQVKTELSEGCCEVWLTSTDNGCYGFDINSDLPELVNTVSQNSRKILYESRNDESNVYAKNS